MSEEVSKAMSTRSPTSAPAELIACTSISFPPPKVEHALLAVHDSQALVLSVRTRAFAPSREMTIPSSVVKKVSCDKKVAN